MTIKKKLFPLILSASMLFAFSSSAFAVSAQPANVTVNPGVNTVTAGAVSFTGVTINTTAPMSSTASNTVNVQDDRGSAAGWSVTLSATDFVSANITDTTGSGTLTTTFPSTAISAAPSAPTVVSGQAVDGTSGPKVSLLTLSTSAQTLIDASPGFGAGTYDTATAYSMTVPKTVSVASVTSTGTKRTPGETVGIMASTYSSTFTYTLAAGI